MANPRFLVGSVDLLSGDGGAAKTSGESTILDGPLSVQFSSFSCVFWEKQVGAPIWKILDPSCICCVGDFRSLLGLALPLENLGSSAGTYIFCQFQKIEIEDILVCTRGARGTSKSTTAFLRTVSSPLQHNQLLMARKRHVNSL